MDWNVLEEYLVQVGADIDRQSFDSALGALNKLKAAVSKLKYAAAPLALAGAIGTIGKAAYETIKGVAQADMEYKKLAASMWVTKETAKSLSIAMKTMGVSQEDLAWVPELREQFFRLREEINKFATPQDADDQLRYIREIGYDVQTLFVRLKMLKEWIAYYLIQYLEPYIKDFKAFINWLLDKLGEDLPGLARKVARAMSTMLSPVLATLKVLGMAIGKIYDFVVGLPENVKKWAAIFAAVGAAIMAGPFGLIIAGLSMAMLLLEDFLGYMNGWDSSADLAPLWEALLKFQEGTGAEWLEKFREVLGDVADILDHIVTELKIHEILAVIKDAVLEVVKGTRELWEVNLKGLSDLLKMFKIGKTDVKEFFTSIADSINTGIKNMAEFAKLFGKLLQAAAHLKKGEVGKAWDVFKDSVVEFGENVFDNTVGYWKREAERKQQAAARRTGAVKKALGYDESPSELAQAAWDEAQRIGSDLDVDPALIYGQWYHETGGFTSDLAREDYNFGGLTTTTDRGPEYKQPDGSLWYMSFDSVRDYADYYKRVWGNDIRGSRSVEEYAQRLKSEGYYGDSYEHYTGGMYAGMQHIPAGSEMEAEEDTTMVAADTSGVQDVPASASFMEGANQAAMSPFQGVLDRFKLPEFKLPDIQVAAAEVPEQTYAEDVGRDITQYLPQPEAGGTNISNAIDVGTPVININVASTNATPKEIAGAVKDGMTDLGEYLMNIQARNMRRPVV